MQDRMMQEVREDLAHIEERLAKHRKSGSSLMSQPDHDERRRKRKAQRAARRVNR